MVAASGCDVLEWDVGGAVPYNARRKFLQKPIPGKFCEKPIAGKFCDNFVQPPYTRVSKKLAKRAGGGV